MIIGIDGNEANIERRVGVNQYAFELLWNIHKLQDIGEAKHQLIVYLKENPRSDMPKSTENFRYKVIPGSGLWILTKLMPHLFLTREKPDVFFSPSHYVPFFAPMPRICSIMDLGYLEFSGQFTKKVFWQLKWWSAISIYISKRIISISNSTKDDIVRHYPFAKGKIRITPLAYDSKRFNTLISENDVRRVKNKYSIVDDYILYLGTLKPSKNIEGLLQAFSEVSARAPGIKLVVAGKKGWLYQSIFDKTEKLGLNDKIVFTDFISEEDKPGLIKGAKVFVLPSFWEGFGLDVLSAMACGVPVVVSNVGSLPEVTGKAGVLVDPNSTNSIAEGITKVINLPKSDYNSMVAAGISQVKKFSWEATARETLKVIENVN